MKKTRVAAIVGLAAVLISVGVLVSCKKSEAPQQAGQAGQAAPASTEAAPQPNPDRNAYFGEEHIHTSWSVDAWLMGNRLTGPDDAYKYAQGQTIKHPAGLRHQDRHAHGLHGCDRPLGICGGNERSQHAGIGPE